MYFLCTIKISMNETKDKQDNKKPENWDSFLKLLKQVKVDNDFLSAKERNQDLPSKHRFVQNQNKDINTGFKNNPKNSKLRKNTN